MKKIIFASVLGLSGNAMAAETVNITPAGHLRSARHLRALGLRQRHGKSGGQPEPDSHPGQKVRAEQPNLILVDAGDTIQGNFVETFKHEGRQPDDAGPQRAQLRCLGDGQPRVRLRPAGAGHPRSSSSRARRWRVISSGTTASPYLPAYTIIERQGVKIGIIGMDTPMTAEFAKGTDRIKGLNFTDPVQAVKQVIRQIDGQVDAIVLVAHMGIDNENQRPGTGVADIANANPELAAIVAGHMHVKIDKAVVNGVIITEPDKYGRALSRIDLQFERRDGKFTLIDKNSYTYSIKGMTPDSAMQALYQPYHDILRANANRVVAKLSGSDLVPTDEFRGIPQVHVQDTGISALFQQAARHYAPLAQVIALQIDNDRAKLDVGDIKAKDIAFNYQYAGGEITVYQLNGKALKRYMEWSAGYFNQLQPGDVTYSFNPARRSSKYSTNDFFDGVTLHHRPAPTCRLAHRRPAPGGRHAGHRRYADPPGHEQLPYGPPDAKGWCAGGAILPGAVRQQSAIR